MSKNIYQNKYWISFSHLEINIKTLDQLFYQAIYVLFLDTKVYGT